MDAICPHLIPADQCIHCLRRLEAELESARSEAAFFREQTEQLLRIIQMAYDCFPDMPAVAKQTLQPYAQEL
jgi:hypothetical protein